MALDYTLKTQEERLECVRETIAATSQEKLDANYLRVMTDYLLFAADRNQTKKEKKKERSIITKNREYSWYAGIRFNYHITQTTISFCYWKATLLSEKTNYRDISADVPVKTVCQGLACQVKGFSTAKEHGTYGFV